MRSLRELCFVGGDSVMMDIAELFRDIHSVILACVQMDDLEPEARQAGREGSGSF